MEIKVGSSYMLKYKPKKNNMNTKFLSQNKLYAVLIVSALMLSSLLALPVVQKSPLALAQSTGSFFDVFLELDSVKGPSTNHPGSIDILSWSWGANNSGNIGSQSSGAGAGKVNMQDISFTKRIDKSSPQLYNLALSGKNTGNAVLTVYNGDGTSTLLELSNVKVSGYGLSSGGDRPMESVTLNFSKIKVTYDVKVAK